MAGTQRRPPRRGVRGARPRLRAGPHRRQPRAGGCAVTFSDEGDCLLPEVGPVVLRIVDLDRDDFTTLGEYDLVICSNVLEHLADPARFIAAVHTYAARRNALPELDQLALPLGRPRGRVAGGSLTPTLPRNRA